jgi:transcriptional regulator with GAF, ATPase, and Fis domain
MDETRQLTTGKPEIAEPRGRPPEGEKRKLEAGFLAVSRREADFAAMAAGALELLIEVLEFERGFILLEEEAGSAAPTAGREAGIARVLASRLRRQGESSSWRDVPNPEFALNRSLLKKAFGSSELEIILDCLIRPGPEGEEQHRTALCQSFPLGAGARGAIYLDRGLSLESVGEEAPFAVASFLECCAPALARAFLEEEVVRLRERLETAGGELASRMPGAEEEGEKEAGAADLAPLPVFHGIVGTDEKLLKVFEIIEKVKDSSYNICIFGESGTGKELVAHAIHEAGGRRERCFVSENCGAIPENLLESELFGHVRGAFTGADEDRQGLFEQAHGGTLFLDEIGDMSEGMQRKLLRALQEGTIRPIGGKQSIKVDVRVICASNRDLAQLVRQNAFRADLYYRLNVIQIHLPPLRERRGDLPLLVRHFTEGCLSEEGIHKRIGESALRALLEYSWPGNVRELRNVIRRVLLTCPRRVIARKDVLPYLSGQKAACVGENIEYDQEHLLLRIPLKRSFNDIIEECERLVLLNALREHGWNKSRVTKALSIPRQSLYNKIARFGLKRDE